MAENPVVVEVPEGEWVLAAQAVTAGIIHRLSRAPTSYLQTFVKTGEAAPTDRSDAAQLFYSDSFATISSDAAIDVYVQAAGKAGSVRVDL